MNRSLIIVLLSLLPGWTYAQFSSEHAAMNNMRKGKWEKAKGQLAKAIRKDSLNPSAHYALGVYFFSKANPDFQVDSAYRYNQQALADFRLTQVKQRERLKKIPLDSLVLVRQREQIDSAAFERAKSINTENGYIDFLKRFPFAKQQASAVELRDEVAYLDAMKENTYTSFQNFLNKYPASTRATEARSRYEKLLYEAKTSDKKLASYEAFLLQHPETFYRTEVEKQIFEIMTASGEPADIEKFIKKYPTGSKTKRAKNILYHLLKERDASLPDFILNDSIRQLEALEKFYLVPFLKDDRFGFMNEEGEEIISATSRQLQDDYLCGNITDDLLVLENQVIARNGAVIYSGPVESIELVGSGILLVQQQNCVRVIHESGGSIGTACYQDAKMIASYVALQKDNRWSVWTITGRMLYDFVWDDIQLLGDVVVFKKSGKYRLAKRSDLARLANQLAVPTVYECDEVRSWPRGMIWIRNGQEEGVLNQYLKEWVKLQPQQITQSFFGAVSKTAIGYTLHNWSSPPATGFIHAKVSQPWVAVQQNGYWQLIDPVTRQIQSHALDTISFNGPFAVGAKNDSTYIYMEDGNALKLPITSRTHFLPGKDSLFFLQVDDQEVKRVYDRKGNLLFSLSFDRIEYNNEGFFTILKKDKRGLVSLQGRVVIAPEYDALGTVSKGVVQVLKDRKFGTVQVNHRKEIKPEYDKNIVAYNVSANVVWKGGLCGLVNWENKPITNLEFEEIVYWSDSAALVKKNFHWSVYNFVERKVIADKIKNLKWISNTDNEKIIIIQQENNFGVLSNRKGTIIPATFTDIVNLGSAGNPLYFTEKHVEEASIYVVIYYNQEGKQLKRQVFEIDDYERIYCDGK